MQRKIRFVSATTANLEEVKSRPLYTSLQGRYDLYIRLENREGLPWVYNRYLEGDYEAFTHFGDSAGEHVDNDIAVFIHDDVFMLATNVEEELNRWADEGYAVLGLAGGKNLRKVDPAFWTNLVPKEDYSGTSTFHYMFVNTPQGVVIGKNYPFASAMGPLGEVDFVDGVFIACHLEAVRAASLTFDEDFSFHFYDISFGLRAKQLGLRTRTVFVPILHTSHGLQQSDEIFLQNQAIFFEKYGHLLK